MKVTGSFPSNWNGARKLQQRDLYPAKFYFQRSVAFWTALVLAIFGFSGATQSIAAGFSTNWPMTTVRRFHTASLLPDGTVLVTGGYDGTNYLSTAEIRNPVDGTWAKTTPMNTRRAGHTATLLQNGKVLVAGGDVSTNTIHYAPTTTAELYDPITRTWTFTGPLNDAREDHTASLLPNGKVLVTGGTIGISNLISAELYDPTNGIWTKTGAMLDSRGYHVAVVLTNGQVLVTGGNKKKNSELYDPMTGLWSQSGLLQQQRLYAPATLLANGKVLISGGVNPLYTALPGTSTNLPSLSDTELYDPVTGIWTTTGSTHTGYQLHEATLLPNGQVLITGGQPNDTNSTRAETYNSDTGTWTTVSNTIPLPDSGQVTTLLADGNVLITGGNFGAVRTAKTEVYDAAIGIWKTTGQLAVGRQDFTANLLPDGTMLVSGGTDISGNSYATAEIYSPVTGTFTNALPMSVPRSKHTATLLSNGKLLVAGGHTAPYGEANSSELYDPIQHAWTPTPQPMQSGRESHTATLLLNGKVLVAGGFSDGAYLYSAELYDPVSQIWTLTGAMAYRHTNHTATLLPDGKVLVAGGASRFSELYDPTTGKWTTTGQMTVARREHAATLLPNGKVLIAGGADEKNSSSFSSAELYDPFSNSWTATGSMNATRHGFLSILLPRGKVLVAGGYSYTGVPTLVSGAEIYDPMTGTWSKTPPMNFSHAYHSGILLANQKIIAVSGRSSSNTFAVTTPVVELYDIGLGYSNSWQPQIESITSPINLANTLNASGSGFRGISEGSWGSVLSSPANYPILQLYSLASGRATYLASMNWSSNSIASVPLTNFPPGYALATVIVNGMPSTGSVVNISVPIPQPTALLPLGYATNGRFQFAFTNAPGATFGVFASSNASLPPTNWTALGSVTEISPGKFQFTDSQMTSGQRFYQLRAP